MAGSFLDCGPPDANGKCPADCSPVIDPLTGKVVRCARVANPRKILDDAARALLMPLLVLFVIYEVAKSDRR